MKHYVHVTHEHGGHYEHGGGHGGGYSGHVAGPAHIVKVR